MEEYIIAALEPNLLRRNGRSPLLPISFKIWLMR